MFTSDSHKHQSTPQSEFGKHERIASDLLTLPEHIQDAFHELYYLMKEPLFSDECQASGITQREQQIIQWYRQQDDEIQEYIQMFTRALKHDDDKSCPYCGLSYTASQGAACKFCKDVNADDGWIEDDDCPFYDCDPRSDHWYRRKNRRNWN